MIISVGDQASPSPPLSKDPLLLEKIGKTSWGGSILSRFLIYIVIEFTPPTLLLRIY
jgi:hypothetical protein